MTERVLSFLRKLKLILYFTGPIMIIALLGLFLWSSNNNRFYEDIFRADLVYQHIAELSSPPYEGRMAGTPGNKLAQEYVLRHFKELGLVPAGDQETYFQNLQSMMPLENSPAYFRIYNRSGKLVKEYQLREHYREILANFGGGGRAQGPLMHLDHKATNYKAEELKGKILLCDYLMDYCDMKHTVESGVQAIFASNYYSNNNSTPIRMSKGSSDLATHEGRRALIYFFDRIYYKHLVQYAEEGCTVDTGLDISYQLLDTPNILGKIIGKEKDSFIIIGAHLDHMGKDFNGKYFPGAIDNASGIGMMLELARVVKAQSTLPQKTIIFAAWNAEEYGIKGSGHYVQHPLYPLERTQVLNIDGVGADGALELIFEAKGELGSILRSRLANYSRDLGLKTKEITNDTGSDHQYFLQQGVPAVLIQDNLWDDPNIFGLHTTKDGIHRISQERLAKTGAVMLNYLKHDLYNDNYPAYLLGYEYLILLLYAGILLAIYLVFLLRKAKPQMKFLGLTAEEIYFTTTFQLVTKAFFLITAAAVILISLIVIASIPVSFNWSIFEGQAYTNFSWYLMIKGSVLYLRNLWLEGLGTTLRYVDIAHVVTSSFVQSLKLILAALFFATTIGIIKGIWDGYHTGGQGRTRLLGTLFVLSLPDVLIVFLAQISLGIFYNQPAFTGLIESETVRRFIVPFLCLSVLPAAYVSRITATIVQEEICKTYVKAARAKGLSNFRIIINHILISVVNRILEALPTVVTIIISNLLVVEYFFYYPGLAFNLFRYYQDHDIKTSVGLSLALGVLYLVCSLVFQAAAYLLNPLKRRSADEKN